MLTISSTDIKRCLAAVHDVGMATFAFVLALLLRYGLDGMPPADQVLQAVFVFAAVAAVTMRAFGIGRGIWRFASLTDLKMIAVASFATTMVGTLLMFLVDRLDTVPRSVPVITWFIMVVALSLPRIVYRLLRDRELGPLSDLIESRDGTVRRLLVVGHASHAERVVALLPAAKSPRLKAIGIIDMKAKGVGRAIHGVPIIGIVDDLPSVLRDLEERDRRPDAIVLAWPREDRETVRRIIAAGAEVRLPVQQIIEPAGIARGHGPLLASLTLDDLLSRRPVRLDLDKARELVSGRSVVVTGAGGSIGSEIVRQIAALGPNRLTMVDHSEYALYLVDREMAERFPAVARSAVLADVRDRERIERLMAAERPDVVFHAAALKHVPLVESNPCEGALTNAIGTATVADAAVDAGVGVVVVISTDKAIKPSSVMGATKRAAEAYCQALDIACGRTGGTRFITVRFGNVLGSTGSVVPLFEHQIRSGGPVTVTHPEMRRYFMTIREATELVLQAAAHGLDRSAERGRIFVLDMGEPVKILDLARSMIALAGLRPEIDIRIQFTGLRPGEKLFEELFDPAEPALATPVEGVLAAAPRTGDLMAVRRTFAQLEKTARGGDSHGVRDLLRELVPELPRAGAGTTAGAGPLEIAERPAASATLH